ncbi:hypothetical protein MPSEU_001004800 [Mayamaea pseudoterrestris]|nr:hypothetical protein MPSEU_001004800 [Mayamaea pseudoterrestris]
MQTPLYSTKDQRKRNGNKGQRPAAFSFSCLVLDKFAAAAENLPITPTRNDRTSRRPEIRSSITDDDESTLNQMHHGESVLSMVSSMDSDANNSGRRTQLRKTLRQQEIASGSNQLMQQQQLRQAHHHQHHPWETTTKTIQQEALRALQCQPQQDDNMTLRTGGDDTQTSMQAVFPDDLSDYELGTIMEDNTNGGDIVNDYDPTAIKKSMTGATNASSQLSQVSPDDLKELVQAASSAVDTLERKLTRCRRISLCLFALLVLVAILAVALAVGLVGNRSAAKSAKYTSGNKIFPNATQPDDDVMQYQPTNSPTISSVVSSLEVLRTQHLPNYTLEAIQNNQSPQFKAWRWLERQAANTSATAMTTESMLVRFVLATLYHASNGRIWKDNSAWLSYESECLWYNNAQLPCLNGTLTELDLSSNNITGVIPQEMELLTGLVKLDLSFNRGIVLPESLFAMQNLRQLELQQVGMSSVPQLPTSLRRLNVRDNWLPRIPPQIANMTFMETMLFGGNFFESQQIPTFLTNLPNLKYLSLQNSQLSGSIPTELGVLSNLEYIILDENRLIGTIPSQLSQLSNLELMTLYLNSLSGTVPLEVCALKSEINMYVSVDCETVQCSCDCGCGL